MATDSFETSIRWLSVESRGHGIEHLHLKRHADEIAVESCAIGDRFGNEYAICYSIKCSSDWAIQEVAIKVVGGGKLHLYTDGQGKWYDDDNNHLAKLSGCIDVDISATPFTNTLPIRRLKLETGERRKVGVVYIQIPTLSVAAVDQAYTCIVPGKTYRYESLSSSFETVLAVDSEGLVLDYPGLFVRQNPHKL